MSERECGDCQLCCTVYKIEALEKPANTACQHLCAKGCGIYGKHPTRCVEFKCEWLVGRMPEEARPDKCGIVFTGYGEYRGKMLLYGQMRSPYTRLSKSNGQLIRTLRGRGHIVVLYFTDTDNQSERWHFYDTKRYNEREVQKVLDIANRKVAR